MLEKNKTPLAYLGTTLVLQYMNGDPCPANPSIKMSTLITFKCNHEIRVSDILQNPLFPLKCVGVLFKKIIDVYQCIPWTYTSQIS